MTRRQYVALIRSDGHAMQVPVSEYSCPVLLYKFREARISSGLPRGDGNFHWTMEMLSSADKEEQMQRKFPDWNRQHSFRGATIRVRSVTCKNRVFLHGRRVGTLETMNSVMMPPEQPDQERCCDAISPVDLARELFYKAGVSDPVIKNGKVHHDEREAANSAVDQSTIPFSQDNPTPRATSCS